MLVSSQTIAIQQILLTALAHLIKKRVHQINRRHQHQSHRSTVDYWSYPAVMVLKISEAQERIHWVILPAAKIVRIICSYGKFENDRNSNHLSLRIELQIFILWESTFNWMASPVKWLLIYYYCSRSACNTRLITFDEHLMKQKQNKKIIIYSIQSKKKKCFKQEVAVEDTLPYC